MSRPRAPAVPVGRALAPAEVRWLGQQVDPREAFRRLWVRKEALIKAGVGSLDGLRELDVVDRPDSSRLARRVRGFDLSGQEFDDIEAGDGSRLVAALALRAAG